MAPNAELTARIQEQYPRLGVLPSGAYVGSKVFKKRLIALYPHEGALIRMAVNHMVKFKQLPTEYLTPPDIPQPPQQPTPQNNSQTLEDWVREQRLIHGMRPNGPPLGWKRLAAKLRLIIPPHLASESIRLDTVIRDILKEFNEAAETVGEGTIVDPLQAVGDTIQAPSWDNSIPESFTAAGGRPAPILGGPSSSATAGSQRIIRLYFRYLPAFQVRTAPSPLGLNPTKLSHYFMDTYVWNTGQTIVCVWATDDVLEFFVDSTAKDIVVHNMETNTPFQHLANWNALDPQNYGYSSHDGGAETLVKWKVVDRMAEICVRSITMGNNTKQMIEEYVAKWIGGFGPGTEFIDMFATKTNEIRGNVQSSTSESLPHLGAALHPWNGSRSLDIHDLLKRPDSRAPPLNAAAPPFLFPTSSRITEIPERHIVQPNGHPPPAGNGFSAGVTSYSGGVYVETQDGENSIPQQPAIRRNAKVAGIYIQRLMGCHPCE
ncbi:hypothetical protein K440DRAFT_70949 [Wilcoxina mikolae CBS 423.85]|nr:hypothetical protein K440DRAFT_70949 [Wilcoxina mikolae CBS 423.85]